MNMTLQFTDAQATEIEETAKRLGVAPEELAKEAVLKFVASTAREFESAAEYVLSKNKELYERLA